MQENRDRSAPGSSLPLSAFSARWFALHGQPARPMGIWPMTVSRSMRWRNGLLMRLLKFFQQRRLRLFGPPAVGDVMVSAILLIRYFRLV